MASQPNEGEAYRSITIISSSSNEIINVSNDTEIHIIYRDPEKVSNPSCQPKAAEAPGDGQINHTL